MVPRKQLLLPMWVVKRKILLLGIRYIIDNINKTTKIQKTNKDELILNKDKQFIYNEPQSYWGWSKMNMNGMNKNGRKQEFMFNPIILNLK